MNKNILAGTRSMIVWAKILIFLRLYRTSVLAWYFLLSSLQFAKSTNTPRLLFCYQALLTPQSLKQFGRNLLWLGNDVCQPVDDAYILILQFSPRSSAFLRNLKEI